MDEQTNGHIEPTREALVFPRDAPPAGTVGAAINPYYLRDEQTCCEELRAVLEPCAALTGAVRETAARLVAAVRRNRVRKGGLDAFLRKYDLSSQEGVILMCLAEALLRIPDAGTADRLIADKLSMANWREHLGSSDSLFVNASTWGLMLTGRMMRLEDDALGNPSGLLGRLVNRLGDPVVRAALRQAMRIMGHQFVMGRNIEAAIKRSQRGDNVRYRHSFDMLGEAALTAADAERYLEAYRQAILKLGALRQETSGTAAAPSISVKLSALFPRYQFQQRQRVIAELGPRLESLARLARDQGVALTVDAEEAERLELSLELFEHVYRAATDPEWTAFGLAVQAYQRRALAVTRWLSELARNVGHTIPVRLVKGAYWDTEIKRAQEAGLDDYPVFTRKVNTDVSYLACARLLFEAGPVIYPQFATHNAHTVASVIHMANGRPFEFQRLHGMGEELYDEIVNGDTYRLPCRVYAPVGSHRDLLPYLVRRLLENGANTSFVNRIVDENAPIEDIIADPVTQQAGLAQAAHPKIPSPRDLFGASRRNSRGVNLSDREALAGLADGIGRALKQSWRAAPVVGGRVAAGSSSPVSDPADRRRQVGEVIEADAAALERAVDLASRSQAGWNARPATERAAILRRAADLLEQRAPEFLALCIREGGKTVSDSIAELREAVDFLRYYAVGAERDFAAPIRLPGPTGEHNQLRLEGRGVLLCISPWNFPLAIFLGQVAAALAAGNSVLAKPAEQTPLVAAHAVRALHEAGVPAEVLHLLPGEGARIGAVLLPDERIAGVAFTGSTETAKIIQRSLAAREGAIATLIAETGGQNAMIVDSSALPEQVVIDAVGSAFTSAGQRCSALRVLMLQQEIAPRVLELLAGHMDELAIGDPALLCTDVGPVIDEAAVAGLAAHVERMQSEGRILHRCALGEHTRHGTFMAPVLVEIDGIGRLEREVFGPVLHVVRYRARDLEQILDGINASGYGLTLGVHSRIDGFARYVHDRIRVGNVYVNRNMIGAVVGVQPFGGCRLSGTGPKAGGPYYLHRFAAEKTLTINTAAVGGNASLLALSGE